MDFIRLFAGRLLPAFLEDVPRSRWLCGTGDGVGCMMEV